MSAQRLELWFFKFVCFFSACWFCFSLQNRFQISAVMAAAITGLLGSFLPTTKRIEESHVHATVYMGAFVAMGSKVVNAGPLQILIVSFIGSTLYFLVAPYFKGLGGRLGLIAFIASLLGVGMRLYL